MNSTNTTSPQVLSAAVMSETIIMIILTIIYPIVTVPMILLRMRYKPLSKYIIFNEMLAITSLLFNNLIILLRLVIGKTLFPCLFIYITVWYTTPFYAYPFILNCVGIIYQYHRFDIMKRFFGNMKLETIEKHIKIIGIISWILKSSIFYVIIIIIALIVHSVGFAIMMALYPSQFSFNGCTVSYEILISATAQSFYFPLMIIVSIAVIISVSGNWDVKIDIMLSAIVMNIGFFAYIILSWTPAYKAVSLLYFPTGMSVTIGYLIHTIIAQWFPIIRTFYWKYLLQCDIKKFWCGQRKNIKSVDMSQSLQEIIKTDAADTILIPFQLYCNREYRGENVSFLMETRKFMKTSSKKDAEKIFKLYIIPEGTFSINIDKIVVKEIEGKIRSFDGINADQIFTKAIEHVVFLINDSFEEFKKTKAWNGLKS